MVLELNLIAVKLVQEEILVNLLLSNDAVPGVALRLYCFCFWKIRKLKCNLNISYFTRNHESKRILLKIKPDCIGSIARLVGTAWEQVKQ